jgi:hypothetical protein
VFVVAVITYLTISMLVRAKKLQMKRLPATMGLKKEDLQQSLSYASIASYAIGTPNAGLVVKTATTLSTVGACGGYLIFVVGLLLPMIQRTFDNVAEFDEKTVTMYLLPVLIPLTWIRSFRGLACISVCVFASHRINYVCIHCVHYHFNLSHLF